MRRTGRPPRALLSSRPRLLQGPRGVTKPLVYLAHPFVTLSPSPGPLDPSSSVSHNTATATNSGGGIFNNSGTLIGAVAPPTAGANVKNNTPDNIVG
jgi:hypothetical protein